MLVFWQHGYEGASLSTLTGAMGISAASMYAAFGNKEALFRQALDRYEEGPGGYLTRALNEPTALQVTRSVLDGAIGATTGPASPNGCLGVQSALVTGDSSRGIRDLLVERRADGYALIRERFERAVDEGDLPASADPGSLARYVTTLAYGISVQAAGGVCGDELRRMVEMALRSFPLV